MRTPWHPRPTRTTPVIAWPGASARTAQIGVQTRRGGSAWMDDQRTAVSTPTGCRAEVAGTGSTPAAAIRAGRTTTTGQPAPWITA